MLSTFTDSCQETRWQHLAATVLSGHTISREDALSILQSSDEELLDLISSAFRIRQKHFGKTVQLYFLMNAKSGLCPEDCHYCSQSKVSDAPIPKYNILSREKLMDGARVAAGGRARPIASSSVVERQMSAK